MTESAPGVVLVTGATGYIGGRLVPRLLAAGYRVRCVARRAEKLRTRRWATDPRVEFVEADVADVAAMRAALAGCEAAFYLVHSMLAAGADYAAHDAALARAFAAAAAAAHLPRIVYLGGLGETGAGLSEHLASRREVERELAAGPTPVTVLRAAMIIGSGSASFEVLRYLVERLPVMVTPRWVGTLCQPIGVSDVLDLLVGCLARPDSLGKTYDIGGADALSYREIMQTMADVLGLRRRLILPVPVLTPRLSSLWIHLVTPISARIARPLAEGLRNPVVCRPEACAPWLPTPPQSTRRAIELAVAGQTRGDVETAWSDAGVMPGDPDWAGGTLLEDRRDVAVAATPAAVFAAVCRIGGGQGWYAWSWLWRLRGVLDRLVGGPGLRRGRRDVQRLGYGDALDFWRVTAIEPERRLELRAEMRLPGIATLTFDLEPEGEGCRLRQTARFQPRGLLGLTYWYACVPLHHLVFCGMLRGIAQAAERGAAGSAP